MFLEVINAEYLVDYKVKLWFNNNEIKVVDLFSSLSGPLFQQLMDKELFKKFSIPYNTIEWENGADFAPEYLYSLPSVI